MLAGPVAVPLVVLSTTIYVMTYRQFLNRMQYQHRNWGRCRSFCTRHRYSRQRDEYGEFLLLLLPSFQLSFQRHQRHLWGGQTGIASWVPLW